MRRVWLGSAVLLAMSLRLGGAPPSASQQPSSSQQPQPQVPTFRGGTNVVQVDTLVSDADGHPVDDLNAADFDVLDDGKPVPITSVRFLGAAEYAGDPTLAPIRTHDDEEREASRDDVSVYAIVLDDYHVRRLNELRVIEPLTAFVGQLRPTDLVGVFYPLDSVTDIAFTRDRAPALKAIRTFYGRLGDDTPKHPVEEEHLRHPLDIPRIRRQITMSALEGLATHLGGLKQGRKTIVFVSEAFSEPLAEVKDLYEAANRSNVAIYPLDPRGLSTDPRVDRGATLQEGLAMVLPAREFMRTLALETGGRPIFGNDVRSALGQVIRDARAYYLIAYESPHPDDGKFHRVSVRVRRPRVMVFARSGYWAFTRGEGAADAVSAAPAVPAVIQRAIDGLAESLRPDANEPAETRRWILPAPSPPLEPVRLLASPTIALAHGRMVGDPVSRREFHRTDTLVIRAATTRAPALTARLLDRRGQPLTALPMKPSAEACELWLTLGSLGAGDYVVELAAQAGDETVQQYVAFRVLR